ncbi:MAG: DUF4252 domain-containing protein [Cephaloticoccus sp.]|nr:DUF4252 domain-containing protein [Cephaloticoccus sp.]MCF7759888.1 DUF4252 domain-containing protein [Cephaloticoccus sp.]
MNSSTPPVLRRRRIWPWVVAAIVLTPVVVLAVTAYSYIHLERDADRLRHQVMKHHQADWQTRVQLSVGSATLASLRGCLQLVPHKDIAEVRQALAAVRQASVGVYEIPARQSRVTRASFLVDTDRAMATDGWVRIVGVVDGDEKVMIYVPEDSDEPERFCLAVVTDEELVVVSATVDPEALASLIEHHAGRNLHQSFRHLN